MRRSVRFLCTWTELGTGCGRRPDHTPVFSTKTPRHNTPKYINSMIPSGFWFPKVQKQFSGKSRSLSRHAARRCFVSARFVSLTNTINDTYLVVSNFFSREVRCLLSLHRPVSTRFLLISTPVAWYLVHSTTGMYYRRYFFVSTINTEIYCFGREFVFFLSPHFFFRLIRRVFFVSLNTLCLLSCYMPIIYIRVCIVLEYT